MAKPVYQQPSVQTPMRKCPKCGRKLPVSASKCPHCGARIPQWGRVGCFAILIVIAIALVIFVVSNIVGVRSRSENDTNAFETNTAFVETNIAEETNEPALPAGEEAE